MSHSLHTRALLLFLGCVPLSPLAAIQDDSPAVLSFAGMQASASEYEDWLVSHRGTALVPTFVTWRMARDEARRQHVALPLADIEAAVEADTQRRIDGAFRGDRQDWVAELKMAGRSEVGHRLQRQFEVEQERSLAALALAGRTVSNDELHNAWETEYGKAGRQIEARLIFLTLSFPSVPGETSAERNERHAALRANLVARGETLRQSILDGADFAEVARRESDDPTSAPFGGRPRDGFSLAGWPAAATQAIEALGVGALSQPIYARGGVWLVQTERIEVTPLDTVAGALRSELLARDPSSAEVNAKRAELWDAANATILPGMYLAVAPDETPVLQLAGKEVTRGEYGTWLRHFSGELAAKLFTEERVIAAAAEESGLTCTREEVEARLQLQIQREIDAFYQGDREAWKRKVVGPAQDEAAYMRRAILRTRIDLLIEKLLVLERTITTEELHAAWEDIHGKRGHSIEFRWIRIDATPPVTDEDMTPERWERLVAEALDEVEGEVARLRTRILAGEDFATLARKYSTDELTRELGGSPPAGFRFGQLPGELAAVVTPLRPGQVAEPARWESAVYLFEVTAIHDVPFETVADELRRDLMERPSTAVEVAEKKLALTRRVVTQVEPAMFR